MSKRKADAFVYDPQKNYDVADFENTTIRSLYKIGKSLGIRDIKKPKKSELAWLILSMHVEAKQKIVEFVLNGIVDTVVEKNEKKVVAKEQDSSDTTLLKMKERCINITFFKVHNDVYFHGNEVAKHLEYNKYADAIYRVVSVADKLSFNDLKSVPGVCLKQTLQFQPETIFINQDGLFDLIIKSRMPLALQFRKWLYREVIPSILNTGVYVSPQLVDELKTKITGLQMQLNEANTNPFMNKVQRNRLENTDYKMEQIYIITSKEYARNYIFKIEKSIDPFKDYHR